MNLDDWRSRINDLDNQILDLLTQRAEAALQIGDLKRRQDAPSYAPEREADIVRRLTEQNDGPLAAEAVVAVWREILSGCRALEAALTVAYLGPQATFTHEAALQHFGAAVTYRPARPIVEVFDDVERGRARRAGGGDRLRACRPPLSRSPLADAHRGQSAELDALPRRRSPAHRSHGARQDLDPLRDAQRARGPLSDPGAARARRHQPHEDRVAPGQAESLGVRHLRRSRRRSSRRSTTSTATRTAAASTCARRSPRSTACRPTMSCSATARTS